MGLRCVSGTDNFFKPPQMLGVRAAGVRGAYIARRPPLFRVDKGLFLKPKEFEARENSTPAETW